MMFENENMPIISMYTRADMLADGELIDVSQMAKECGFKFPVAVSRMVWVGKIEPDEKTKANGESTEGRLWDVLWMLSVAIKKGINRCPGSTDQKVLYKVLMNFEGSTDPQEVILKSIVGPGDNFEPVISIFMPEED